MTKKTAILFVFTKLSSFLFKSYHREQHCIQTFMKVKHGFFALNRMINMIIENILKFNQAVNIIQV